MLTKKRLFDGLEFLAKARIDLERLIAEVRIDLENGQETGATKHQLDYLYAAHLMVESAFSAMKVVQFPGNGDQMKTARRMAVAGTRILVDEGTTTAGGAPHPASGTALSAS